jgi:hypothetical protein
MKRGGQPIPANVHDRHSAAYDESADFGERDGHVVDIERLACLHGAAEASLLEELRALGYLAGPRQRPLTLESRAL